MPTKIEWATESWNPVTGCTKVSEGCVNCYAERMARRLAGRCGYPDYPDHFDVTLHPDRLNQPLRWKKPRRIFVCSMGDLFHEDVEWADIVDVWDVMREASWHTFLVLTKRPQAMFDYVMDCWLASGGATLPNVWLGVTAENQRRADERIPLLLQVPAAVRFVSCEPLLGPVAMRAHLTINANHLGLRHTLLTGDIVHCQGHRAECFDCLRVWVNRNGIDWVIVGCESGPRRRPSKREWFESLCNQCAAADVPFFLKQMEVDGRLVHLPELDGKVWNEYPRQT